MIARRSENNLNLLGDCPVDHTDFIDQRPGYRVEHEKLSLFSLFDQYAAKIRGRDSIPVDPVELLPSVEEIRYVCPSVAVAEGPFYPLFLSPSDRRPQIGLQVNDGPLSVAVVDVWMATSAR